MTKNKYRLRFFIEYGAGSLWADNEAAYEKFDVGPLDETIYSLDKKVLAEPKIKLPADLESTRKRLIDLYNTSLDQNDPGGFSLWTETQWDNFHKQTREFIIKFVNSLGTSLRSYIDKNKNWLQQRSWLIRRRRVIVRAEIVAAWRIFICPH